MKKGFPNHERSDKAYMHEKGVCLSTRGLTRKTCKKWGSWFRDWCLTMMWLTQILYGSPKNSLFGSKRKCIVDEGCWSVEMLSMEKETCQLFNLNCTTVYEWRRILWITRAYAPYSKILSTRIWIIPLILRCFTS